MGTNESPQERSADDTGGSEDSSDIVPKDLVRKARALGHEALVESICHALQFIDEPEEVVRSLIQQIQRRTGQDAVKASGSAEPEKED